MHNLLLLQAERGEFSERAFLHGKLDLTALEGVADLLAAETSAQRKQALLLSGGALRRKLDAWRDAVVGALARTEAAIDFGDEEDGVDGGAAAATAAAEVRELLPRIRAHLACRRAERLRDGATVALVGRPNAGKSTLQNALAGAPISIVAATPGTTRDVVEVPLDLAGYKVAVADLAGLRAETTDPVEAEGIRRARARAAGAEVRVLVLDASDLLAAAFRGRADAGAALPETASDVDADALAAAVAEGAAAHEALADGGDEDVEARSGGEGGAVVLALTKTDLLRPADREALGLAAARAEARLGLPAGAARCVSGAAGQGLEGLSAAVAAAVAASVGAGKGGGTGEPGEGFVGLLARERHRHHLGECTAALERFLRLQRCGRDNDDCGGREGGDGEVEVELAAEELRRAAAALGRLTGRVDPEDVLGRIFAEFCIGK